MHMKNPNNLPTIDTGIRFKRGIGAVMLLGALSSCANNSEPSIQSVTPSASQQVDMPNSQIESPSSQPSIEVEVTNIESNIVASNIESVNLFKEKQTIKEHRVYRDGNFIDLVPPVQDGIFSVILPNKNDNPAGYSFNGTLATDSDGRIIGDLLIGGHTNSGDNWVMNEISSLKIGDTQKYTFEDATYTTVVTKITHIKKTGDAHAWPGFDKALGEDGAIFGCRLTKDSDGNTVQSGDVTIVGIKVISAQTNN